MSSNISRVKKNCPIQINSEVLQELFGFSNILRLFASNLWLEELKKDLDFSLIDLFPENLFFISD